MIKQIKHNQVKRKREIKKNKLRLMELRVKVFKPLINN